MKDLKPRGSFDFPHTLRVFLGLRMIVLALVLGAGIMIAQLSQDDFSVGPLYLLLVLSYLAGGVLYASVRLGVKPLIGVWFMMVVDIALETAILHFSGGVTGQFALVFCLSIIAAAFLLQVPGGLGIALLASVSYVGYGLLETRGFVTPPGTERGQIEPWSYGFLQMYMHVSVFFLVGAVGGYLAERTKLKGRLLESAETELKLLKIDTDNILKHMSSGVLVIDSDGKILSINPVAEQILGVDKNEVQSRDMREVFDTVVPEFANELVRALRSDESRHRHEFNANRRGRHPLPLGISISQLKDDDDQRRGIIAVFQDLTEVRNMQERIRRADRLAAIGELSAGIAHEIRNPLASISGSIEMLSNELKLSGEHRRLMELIAKESDRLDRIINDFLEFARVRPPSRTEVSISDCLEDVAVLLQNNAAVSCRVNAETTEECKDLMVRVDEEQMKQVFLNLGLNACEAMPQGGELRIQANLVDGGLLRIIFADHGQGIPEEARGRLFEPFYTTKDGGTGLGLAIANKIVEAHGGRIEAGNHEGGGAEFVITFDRSVLRARTSEHDKTSSLT